MNCHQSRYAGDSRVAAGPNDSFMVDFHGTDYFVHCDPETRQWSASAHVDGAPKVLDGYDTADDAIAFLIGPPANWSASA